MNNLFTIELGVYGTAFLIFVARVADMTLDTSRIVCIARGQKVLASILGFFEILIWLFAISQVLQNLTTTVNALAYAGGFAAGNYLGLFIEQKMALGKLVVRIITRRDSTDLIQDIQNAGLGLTAVDAQGAKGKVKLLFSVIKRSDLPRMIAMIRLHNPQAFVSVEDIRQANEGIFPTTPRRWIPELRSLLTLKRKSL